MHIAVAGRRDRRTKQSLAHQRWESGYHIFKNKIGGTQVLEELSSALKTYSKRGALLYCVGLSATGFCLIPT